jgi:hypothetical protein
MSERAEINDIYEGAYLLQSGCQLVELEWDRDGHARLILSGETIRKHIDAFRGGNATGNICLYLFSLERLKDKLFMERRQRGGRA